MKKANRLEALEKAGHISRSFAEWMLSREEDTDETTAAIAAAIGATAKAHAQAESIGMASRYVVEGSALWEIDQSGSRKLIKRVLRTAINPHKLHLKIKH